MSQQNQHQIFLLAACLPAMELDNPPRLFINGVRASVTVGELHQALQGFGVHEGVRHIQVIRKGQMGLHMNLDKPCVVFVTYNNADRVTVASTILNQKIVCSKYPVLACPALPRTTPNYPVQRVMRTTAKSGSTATAAAQPKFPQGLCPKQASSTVPPGPPPQPKDIPPPPWRQPVRRPPELPKAVLEVKEEQKVEPKEATPGLAEVETPVVNLVEDDLANDTEKSEECEKKESEVPTEEKEPDTSPADPPASSPVDQAVAKEETTSHSPQREAVVKAVLAKEPIKKRKKKKKEKTKKESKRNLDKSQRKKGRHRRRRCSSSWSSSSGARRRCSKS